MCPEIHVMIMDENYITMHGGRLALAGAGIMLLCICTALLPSGDLAGSLVHDTS